MKNSIRIDFPSYKVMVDFCGTFDLVSEHFSRLRNDENECDFGNSDATDLGNSNATWEDTRFSVLGAEVSDATSHELFQYFYNGSTGGFDWEREDGSTKIIRKGIVNPRGQY